MRAKGNLEPRPRRAMRALAAQSFCLSVSLPGWFVVLSVRPKVAELSFHVFARGLHPELYRVHASREVQRNGYRAKVEITDCGHVVTLKNGCGTICEVAAAKGQLLPTRRCKLGHRLKGSRTAALPNVNGVAYRTHFQLESVKPDVFYMMQKQLSAGPTHGLVHHFDATVRTPLAPMSYINLESRSASLRVQAIHTFPDDYAIVKVESLFTMDDD